MAIDRGLKGLAPWARGFFKLALHNLLGAVHFYRMRLKGVPRPAHQLTGAFPTVTA